MKVSNKDDEKQCYLKYFDFSQLIFRVNIRRHGKFFSFDSYPFFPRFGPGLFLVGFGLDLQLYLGSLDYIISVRPDVGTSCLPVPKNMRPGLLLLLPLLCLCHGQHAGPGDLDPLDGAPHAEEREDLEQTLRGWGGGGGRSVLHD